MKFLTDAQVNAHVVRMLRALGWQVETVEEHGIADSSPDEWLVAWARERGFVFLTFDAFSGMTRAKVMAELRGNGGKVLQVHGGPEQPPERAVGRMLFHYPEWFPWLKEHDGLATLSDIKHNCKLFPAKDLGSQMRTLPEPPFDRYLEQRNRNKSLSQKPRIRQRARSTEQGELLPPSNPEE